MSMNLESGHDGDLVTDINMTPLIDVMLVLLIIFIITLPVMTHALKVDLPKAASDPVKTDQHDIDLSIRADGSVAWNKVSVDDATLAADMAAAAAQSPLPDVRIYADAHVEYGRVARVLSAAQHAGLSNLDFVTEPESGTSAPGSTQTAH
ncbi:ExbD/TolR family protein [Pararobbsia silviterrae]|uniref:Biopolymer transporter ExbD n=1 Tax=Pararobbsia silviterrae TaxID=1792498 RepID=A0A494Y660_9BURK|nr:biopolymer transporter ExbD [Pararobbsia silviterrae]RKP57783.1 biopolymer transporter ExbD [Pararobbsia silviterrae]